VLHKHAPARFSPRIEDAAHAAQRPFERLGINE